MFLLMLLVSYVEYRMGFKQPHYNPLGGDRYQDLMEFPPVYRLLHTARFFDGVGYSRVAYPPFGALVCAALYATGHTIGVYLTTAALWVGSCVMAMRRALMRYGIDALTASLFPLTVALTSFPIAGLLQRGNIELYLWICVGLGAWAYFSGREHLAAFFWGLSTAMKMYPAVLFLLPLLRRRLGPLVSGAITVVGVTFLSMSWIGPSLGVVWRGWIRNVFGYQGARASQWELHELLANHTAFNLAKLGAMIVGIPLGKLTLPYYVCGALILGLACWRLRRMPVANQFLAITAFMVVFPPVSYFYTLVQLYAPWVVLVFVAVRAAMSKVEVPGLKSILLLMLPLFGSFMLLSFPRVLMFGGLLQAALLIFVFLSALGEPLEVPTPNDIT
jgi:hypothetical protein